MGAGKKRAIPFVWVVAMGEYPNDPLVWSLGTGEDPNEDPTGTRSTVQPMTKQPRSVRISLRMTSTQKSNITDAVRAAGTSVNSFAVETLLREAQKIVQEQESWAALEIALARPAKSIEELADLLRRPSVFED